MSAFFNKPTTTRIDQIKWDPFHPRALTDLTDILESIQTIGIVQPIVINKDNVLLTGKRRMAAAVKAGLDSIPTFTVDVEVELEDLVAIDENIIRLPLNSAEYDEALLRRKVIYEQKFPNTRLGFANRAGEPKLGFAEDTMSKLDISRRSVEKAIARAKFATTKVKEARGQGLAPSKVNELITLDPIMQDEVLPMIQGRSYMDVKDIVKRIKDVGIEDAIKDLQKSPHGSWSESLERELTRVQREFGSAMNSKEPLQIGNKSKVIKMTRDVMRLMRDFIERVKSENDQLPGLTHSLDHEHDEGMHAS